MRKSKMMLFYLCLMMIFDAKASEWGVVYDGDSALFSIASAYTNPDRATILVVEINMNHMNRPSRDGKQIIRSDRTYYEVNCQNRRFRVQQWAMYDDDRQKGNIVMKGEFELLINPEWRHADSESSEEYIIGKVCQAPKL